MSDNLKVDLINGAYSQLRISGLTVIPSENDNVLALRRLEGMMNEFSKRNICVGYNFEDAPDINSTCGVDSAYWFAIECILAGRLLADFGKGKEPDPVLLLNARAGMSFLYSSTATPVQTQYPSRQSIGAGNTLRFGRTKKFYTPVDEAPPTCATNNMIVGDIDNFIEHFDSYLIDTEVISAYTITSDTGLTIVSDSNTDTDVNYQVSAVGPAKALLQVKIVVTTDSGRITTRLIDFSLTKLRTLS